MKFSWTNIFTKLTSRILLLMFWRNSEVKKIDHFFILPEHFLKILLLYALVNTLTCFIIFKKNIISGSSLGNISQNQTKRENSKKIVTKKSFCGKYGNDLIFENVYLVLTCCFEHIPIRSVEKVARQYNITVRYAKCNSKYGKIEANEVGTILHWIIDNWDKIEKGQIAKIIFHHAHEFSLHQEGRLLSEQLRRLLDSYDYFCYRDFGEIYPFYIEHDLINETAFICAYDFIKTLDTLTAGTSFAHFNRSNSKNIWRSGRNSAFFVSSTAITNNHNHSDYEKMLDNIHKTVVELDPKLTRENYRRSTNFYVGECVERFWFCMFTNQSYSDYEFPKSFGKIMIA